MALVFIGLGSNLGEGRKNLLAAWNILGRAEGVSLLSISSPYLSSPVGMASDFWFTNAVGVLETSLAPDQLLGLMLAIEKEMGRDRSAGADRLIDLDIIYYNDMLISSDTLTIPHPEIRNRLFVLAPLAELAPDHVHPGIDLSTKELHRLLLLSDSKQIIKKSTWSDELEPC